MIDKINDYIIQSILGKGGMATVYLAENPKFGVHVAVKVLNREHVHNRNIRERFFSEAKYLYKLSHPNIVKATDLIEEGEVAAYVMEYLDGETLKDYIARKGGLANIEINSLFVPMLEAVGFVHHVHLVHRDIKPSNFMIGKDGIVKLMDFGIVKNIDPSVPEYTMTGTGQQMGTPMYMSPEQVKSSKSVTTRSDIYSLGVVLWQMVTGRKPYDAEILSTFDIQTKIVNEPLESTNTMWDRIIRKATQKSPERRFESCIRFRESMISESSLRKSTYTGSIENTIFGYTDTSEKTVIDNAYGSDGLEKGHATQKHERRSANHNRKNEVASVFPHLTIGNQIWMLENLNVDRFRNGNLIPEASTPEEWKDAARNKKPAWCHYDNDPSNGVKFGRLYNWFAVNDSRGLAPTGWHVATDREWKTLADHLGGDGTAGNLIKSSQGWGSSIFGFLGGRKSGFNALPAGGRYDGGQFLGLKSSALWWTASLGEQGKAIYRFVTSGEDGLSRRKNGSMGGGLSVRCIRD
jgi:uncharacterized protein (TIGR02145 family)